MHRSLRMLGIVLDLQRGPSTLGKLAEKYECCSRTIQRDAAALLELSLLITSSPGANGGVAIDPRWVLGPLK